jgi:hypothetical protein
MLLMAAWRIMIKVVSRNTCQFVGTYDGLLIDPQARIMADSEKFTDGAAVTCPIQLDQPVIQEAKGPYLGGARTAAA